MNTPERKSYRVFVGGLPYSTGDDVLRQFGERFGNVRSANVMRDGPKGKSRGFGFITFADKESRDNALIKSERMIQGRTVELKKAVPRDSDGNRFFSSPARKSDAQKGTKPSEPAKDPTFAASSCRKIFCGGLHYSTTEDDLRDYFQQFGPIESVQVVYSRETNRSRGFGFVVFVDTASVESVLSHRMHTINDKTVEVKLAVPKDTRYPNSPGSRSSADNDHLDARASWLSPGKTAADAPHGMRQQQSGSEGNNYEGGRRRWSNIVAANPPRVTSTSSKTGTCKSRSSTMAGSEIDDTTNPVVYSQMPEEQSSRSRASTLPASFANSFDPFGTFTTSELGLFGVGQDDTIPPTTMLGKLHFEADGEPNKPDIDTPQILRDPVGDGSLHSTNAQCIIDKPAMRARGESGGSHFSLYSQESHGSVDSFTFRNEGISTKDLQTEVYWVGTGLQSSSDSMSNPSSQHFESPVDAPISVADHPSNQNVFEQLTEGHYSHGMESSAQGAYPNLFSQDAASFVPTDRWNTEHTASLLQEW